MSHNFLNITLCPATLQSGYTTYCPKAIKEVFNGNKVSHILPFNSPYSTQESTSIFFEKRKRISISGVQEKYSVKIENNQFVLTQEAGEYILKPIPTNVLFASEVPANEHVTMQIAKQVFKLNVAQNALVFFSNGEPAYITKRFDVKQNGSRCLKEDFASLAQQSIQNAGINYKYNYCYKKMAALIDAYFPASMPAKEQFFGLIIFNYLFSNGDAHLKNFSRMDCDGKGDGMLAPAYDLLNTNIHTGDNFLALEDGLYEKDYNHPSYAKLGYYGYNDFVSFGVLIGLIQMRVERIVNNFLQHKNLVEAYVQKSFLSASAQKKYLDNYYNRYRMLCSKA